jgi:hypothetical protein
MKKCCLIMLVVYAGVAAAGCAENKMTRQRFDMIKEGMSTQDEVRQTLGDKYTALGNQWEYEDERKDVHATIHFDPKGVVTKKEWMNGRTGEWSGAAPAMNESRQGPVTTESRSHGTVHKD